MLKVLAGLAFCLILKTSWSAKVSNYSKDALKKQYPDYGTKWMYFPDAKEIPRVVYLEMPSNDFRFLMTDVEQSMSFRLYTRHSQEGTPIFNNATNLRNSTFDPSKATKFITHGWLSNGLSDTCLWIKDAFLEKEDANVFIMDWKEVAGNIIYPIPMAHTKTVGEHYATFVDQVVASGADLKSIHLIGHSLGAHVSGFTGRAISSGRPGRITALDPALPGFTHGFKVDHLLTTDAEFVDVIHTCGGVLGFLNSLGHADFYPNGGYPPQPGCEGLNQMIEACSHGRSWKYFAESILSERKFLSKKCNSWVDYQQNSCEGELVPMGNPVPASSRGTFYLSTEASPPFAKAVDISDVDSNDLNK